MPVARRSSRFALLARPLRVRCAPFPRAGLLRTADNIVRGVSKKNRYATGCTVAPVFFQTLTTDRCCRTTPAARGASGFGLPLRLCRIVRDNHYENTKINDPTTPTNQFGGSPQTPKTIRGLAPTMIFINMGRSGRAPPLTACAAPQPLRGSFMGLRPYAPLPPFGVCFRVHQWSQPPPTKIKMPKIQFIPK